MNELETDAQKVLQMEAEAILDLIPRVDEHFDAAVDMILSCEGRVIMTGMGKSGIIAHKISATLASTGTPSFYLHPAEGIHGDLGMVTADDVIIAMSNSGETGEVLNILPSLRRIGAKLIAMVGNTDSTLPAADRGETHRHGRQYRFHPGEKCRRGPERGRKKRSLSPGAGSHLQYHRGPGFW